MAKLTPGVRLLRTLVRSARSQQKSGARLIAALAPKPAKASKPARKPAREQQASAPRPRAPGKWLAGQYPPPLALGPTLAPALPYWLYLPARAPDAAGGRGWPLVVMLHGCQQSATQFADGSRMNQLAEEQGYAVLYPQQGAHAQAQRCWRWYDRAVQEGGGEAATLAALVDDVCTRYRLDRGRVYACGLSAGAAMAAVLALNYPERIAAVGRHSGPVFGAAHGGVAALQVMRHGAAAQGDAAIAAVLARAADRPLPPMPALLIHGDDDQVVRPVNQQQLARQWLQLNGLSPEQAPRVALKAAGRGARRRTYALHDYLRGRKVVLRVVRIAGLGHAWSGGDPALKFNAEAGPDASRMLLDFFGRHRR